MSGNRLPRAAAFVGSFTLTVLALASFAEAAPILQVNGSGILTGAVGVNVEGTLYDVEFVDGSCVDLFTGCDDASDMLDYFVAPDAMDALAAQVFSGRSGLGHLFDTHPELTFGCSDPTGCIIFTPIFDTVSFCTGCVIGLDNRPFGLDPVFISFEFPTTDYSLNPFRTYARFDNPRPAPPPAAVPEPATLTLLGLGLAGMGARRSRQRRA